MARASGISVQIEGLEKYKGGLDAVYRLMPEVMRDILRGPFGEEFEQQIKALMSDHTRTGYTRSRVSNWDSGSDGVEIGIKGSDTATHPSSKRANARSVGVWLESGTRMHLIPTKIAPYTKMSFGGGVYSRVNHPGHRGYRIMGRTLRTFRRSAEELIIRELDRRLGPRIGMT